MNSDRFMASSAAGLHTAIPGLHATPAAPLPFLSGVVVRSFVLEREQGNVIIYHSPGITAALSDILALGHPERLLVNHWHEAMFDPPGVDTPIFVHEKDRARTNLSIAGTFAGRETIGEDLELIPTPGHTAGTTMFLWHHGGHRLLFSGDSIWVHGGRWEAVLLAEHDRAAYIASIERVMGLDFDILVPWGSEEGQPYAYAVNQADTRANLAAILLRLKAGENA